MFVGAPCLYYGTELPLEGGYDPDNRRCFDWNREQWNRVFMDQVRCLLALRREKAVQSGEIRMSGCDGLFILQRYDGAEELTLCCNQTAMARKPEAAGRVHVQNGYDGNHLEPDGFVVFVR